jgi:hypothetical protein
MNSLTSTSLRSACLLVLNLVGSVCSHAAAIAIGIPYSGATGGGDSLIPFGLDYLGWQSSRYQQVYNASDFTRTMPQGGYITAIQFRADFTIQGFDAHLPAVQIDLSTTGRGSDQLSSTFGENVGNDNLTVLPKGPLYLSVISGGSTRELVLQNPFFYDPSRGNLLLDIRDFAAVGTRQAGFTPDVLNGWNNAFGVDTISRVYASDVNALTGTADSFGLTTFFTVTPVPEPCALGLIALCGAALVGWGVKARNSTPTH